MYGGRSSERGAPLAHAIGGMCVCWRRSVFGIIVRMTVGVGDADQRPLAVRVGWLVAVSVGSSQWQAR
jgi:hypothetical protein